MYEYFFKTALLKPSKSFLIFGYFRKNGAQLNHLLLIVANDNRKRQCLMNTANEVDFFI